MSEPSNLRWDKVSPRTWMMRIQRPDKGLADTIEITLDRPQSWQLFVNHQHLATLPTWTEASNLAPILYQLHKD